MKRPHPPERAARSTAGRPAKRPISFATHAITALVAIAGILATAGVASAAAPARDSSTILVKFESPSTAREKANAQGDKVVAQTGTHVEVIRIERDETVGDELAIYRGRGDVTYAEPNFIANATLAAPNDPSWGRQWAFPKIQAVDGWGVFPGSYTDVGGAKLAVVDTGVQDNHPDLAGRVDTGAAASCVNATDACTAGSAGDDNGHGTHVAGIAGAATNNEVGVAGTAFDSPIVPVKVLNSRGSGTYAAITNGVLWAAQHGARVINLSLGGYSYSQTLCDAVATVEGPTYNALVVAAAGNDGISSPLYPAACSGAVGVAATDSNDGSPVWSNFGAPDVYVSAPGVSIYSTYPTSTYASLSGTSMATPFVTGLSALLFGQTPSRTPSDVTSVLKTTADHVGGVTYGADPYGTCTGCWHDWYGYGRINVFRALNASSPPPPPAVVTLSSLTLNPTSVTSGGSSQGTVTLSGPAPSGGASVALSSDNAAATVPSSVVVPGGATSATFTATASSVTTSTTANISASYGGVTKTAALTVNPLPTVVTAAPNATTISRGSLAGGSASSLAAADTAYYQVRSTSSSEYTSDWYGSFTGVPSTLSALKVTYQGYNSRSCSQTIYIYNWSSESWLALDSRTVGTTEMRIADISVGGTQSSYVSGSGGLRVRVRCRTTSGTFVANGNQLQISYRK